MKHIVYPDYILSLTYMPEWRTLCLTGYMAAEILRPDLSYRKGRPEISQF